MRLSLYVCGVINSLSLTDSGKLILRIIFHYFTLIGDFMLSNKPCRKKVQRDAPICFSGAPAGMTIQARYSLFEA